VYGRESMRRLACARILVAGMNGLGVEIGARDGTSVCCPNAPACLARGRAADLATHQRGAVLLRMTRR
jgi:hypothetical protein